MKRYRGSLRCQPPQDYYLASDVDGRIGEMAYGIENALQWGNGDTVRALRALLAEDEEAGK